MHLEVREAQARDLPGIKRLCDENIAVDFYTEEELEKITRGEDDLLFVVADENEGSRVVSFFYAFLSTMDEALRVLHVPQKPEAFEKYAGDERVGVYKTTATDPDYRRQGLFSAFMADLQPVLRERGAKCIITTALCPYGREMPTMNVLKRTGFTPVMDLHRPWEEMDVYCPYCRRNHCICDAVLYIREFDGIKDGKGNE